MGKHKSKRLKVRLAAPPPSLADHGAQTAAQNAGTKIEPVADCKNGSTQRVRRHALETTKGLSKRQLSAGEAISKAYEAMFKTPPAIKEINVDSSPRPDATVEIQIGRASKHAWIKSAVPSEMRAIVELVCEDGMAIGSKYSGDRHAVETERLKAALDIVADHIGC